MDIPLVIFGEIYDLLYSHNETPKMSRNTFADWYAKLYSKNYIPGFDLELNNLMFSCDKNFSCCVFRKSNLNTTHHIDDKTINQINEKLNDLISRFNKTKLFW